MGPSVGVWFFELPHLIISEDVILVDPHVVRVRVPLPFDQILQSPSSAEQPRVQNLLDFIFLGVINQIGRWALIVGAVRYCFTIRREKVYVKHGMDAPLRG
jgi:hypothetical protein